MAKAIVGSHADPRTFALLEEVRALRARVASLEQALQDAERALAASESRVVELDRSDDDYAHRPLDAAAIG
ncbi:MAG TPA: hypothetical protein VHF25_16460 [Nitriliruptorales bacterium]|nr:hypothetical protein [Nitriliruptorales bacterium]